MQCYAMMILPRQWLMTLIVDKSSSGIVWQVSRLTRDSWPSSENRLHDDAAAFSYADAVADGDMLPGRLVAADARRRRSLHAEGRASIHDEAIIGHAAAYRWVGAVIAITAFSVIMKSARPLVACSRGGEP